MSANKKRKSSTSSTADVTRADIEAKLKEIDTVFDDATSTGKDIAKLAIGIGVAIAILLAFRSGRRRGLRPKTLVTFTKTR